MMNDEFQLTPLPPDADTAEMLEAIGPLEERPAESQYCVFRSGRERFCLPVLDVEEVLEWPIVTKLPLGPSYLMGIFNLRGAIVPLVDIAMTEGRRPGLLPKHVVVASMRVEGSHEDVRIGIASDEVVGTYSELRTTCCIKRRKTSRIASACCATTIAWRWFWICPGSWKFSPGQPFEICGVTAQPNTPQETVWRK